MQGTLPSGGIMQLCAIIGDSTTVAREAANRWTGMRTINGISSCYCIMCIVENVFAVKSWCKNKFCLEEAAIDKQFGIPDDFDYL